ncbi:uncharacterized protein [Palaemon carinicauda]|uniref:uncharacterized protein n=1 Tax=Palaemon carinicauda TaxID=392227 RepID=UPI0035B58D81
MNSGVGTFLQPQLCFAHIHVNVVGVLHISQGHHYLFTGIDSSTHWPKVITMETAMYLSSAYTLLSGWIVRFDILLHITSKRSKAFTSLLWTSLVNFLGITIPHITADSPATNKVVDGFQCTLQKAMMSSCKDSNWLSMISWIFLGLRRTKNTTDVSAAKLFLSTTAFENHQRLLHIVENILYAHRGTRPR